jgi:glycosyltransferase involved in cell wall biosynthesis
MKIFNLRLLEKIPQGVLVTRSARMGAGRTSGSRAPGQRVGGASVTESNPFPTPRAKRKPPRADEVQAHGLEIGGARACVLIPAYEAARTLERVIVELRQVFPEARTEDVLVVDDGSTDATAHVARTSGASLLSYPENRGKGAALVRGLQEADALGYGVALTVDADGQHPATSAREVFDASDDPGALVLGVRSLRAEGAPRANRFSNGISNFFLSVFARRRFRDTQCGLRRYPVKPTLAFGARAAGYAFEAEVLLRANAADVPIVERQVRVFYPPEHERVTHFDSVRDPVRIIRTVLSTVYDLETRPHARR